MIHVLMLAHFCTKSGFLYSIVIAQLYNRLFSKTLESSFVNTISKFRSLIKKCKVFRRNLFASFYKIAKK